MRRTQNDKRQAKLVDGAAARFDYRWVKSISVRNPITSMVFSIGSAPAYTVTAYGPGTTCGISKWPLVSAKTTYGVDVAMICADMPEWASQLTSYTPECSNVWR